MNKFIKLLVTASAMLLSSLSFAAPITYQGDLTAAGTVSSSMQKEHWWQFSANAGDQVTIQANRLEFSLDPALVLYQGIASESTSLVSLASADDEIEVAGPWGDPRLVFDITTTGAYSVRVFSFFSMPKFNNSYDYSISVAGSSFQSTAVSEPATFGIMALALFGAIGLRRRFV